MLHTTINERKEIEGLIDLAQVDAIQMTGYTSGANIYTIVFKSGAVLKGYQTTGLLNKFKSYRDGKLKGWNIEEGK